MDTAWTRVVDDFNRQFGAIFGAPTMPWSPDDGPARHTKKAKSPAAKRQWSKVANKELAKSGDEGKAIRIASAAVAKRTK